MLILLLLDGNVLTFKAYCMYSDLKIGFKCSYCCQV